MSRPALRGRSGRRSVEVEWEVGEGEGLSPVAFRLGGTWHDVLGFADRWYDKDAAYFKVRADDGHRYLLRHDRRQDAWSLVTTFSADA